MVFLILTLCSTAAESSEVKGGKVAVSDGTGLRGEYHPTVQFEE